MSNDIYIYLITKCRHLRHFYGEYSLFNHKWLIAILNVRFYHFPNCAVAVLSLFHYEPNIDSYDCYTVERRYLELGYLEQLDISNRFPFPLVFL